MNRYALIAGIVVMSAMGTAWAHDGLLHVLGTVTEIDAHHIEVDNQNGRTTSLEITKDTMFVSSNTQSHRPLRKGDRVLIHVGKMGDTLRAVEVKYFTPGGTPWAMHE